MIDAGEVGARFVIKDDASSVLVLLMGQFEKLDALIKGTSEKLNMLRMPSGMSRGIGVMNEQMTKLAASSEKAMAGVSASLAKIDGAADAALTGVTTRFEKLDGVVTGTKVQVAELSAELKRVGEQMATVRGLPGGRRPGGGGGGSGGGHGGGGVHVMGPGMALPGGAHVNTSSKSDGFWEMIGGAALLEGTKKIVEARMELSSLESHAKAAGYTSAQQAEIMGAAWANAGKTTNTTAVESYKNILELAQVTGSYGEAIKMLPSFTSASAALASLKDEGLKGTVGGKAQTYNFARSLELLGVTQDEGKLSSMTATITREIIGMRGLVDGSKLFQGIQNAGGARYAWNEDFVGHVLGPLLQASPRAGAGLYQLDRSFGSGVATQQMARGAEKYGFWNKDDEAYDDADHKRFKGMKTGTIAGYDMLRSNPEEWAMKVALPLFKSHGVDINDTNAMGKAINEISRGNKNLNVILDELLLPGTRAQLAKERANIDKVPGDAGGILMKEDPALKMAALKDKWNDLMTALGGPLIDNAMSAVTGLTKAFSGLAQFFNANPGAAKLAADGMGVLGAGLLASGGLKMGKFLLGDLFGAGSGAALTASATALDGSAAALTAAAGKLAAGGAVEGAAGLVGKRGLGLAAGLSAGLPWMVGGAALIGAGVYGISLIDPHAPVSGRGYSRRRSVFDGLNEAHDGDAHELTGFDSDAGHWQQGRGYQKTWVTDAPKSAAKDWSPSLPQGWGSRVSTEIGGALSKIPGDVNPSVTSAFASISSALTSAIASLAAAASAAAAAIPTGAKAAPVQVHSSIHVDGKKVAHAVTTHQLLATRTAKSTGAFDGSDMPSPTDYAWG